MLSQETVFAMLVETTGLLIAKKKNNCSCISVISYCRASNGALRLL